jgi:hypothetical protein
LHILHIYIVVHILHIYEYYFCRLRKDRKTFKEVPLFGVGMLQMIYQVFWNLPFASSKQATAVREKFNHPEEDWEVKREELEKEHKADGARDQLRAGWVQWLGGAVGPTAVRVAPASLATPIINETD